MPYTNVPQALTGKMDRCVESVMKRGSDKPTAIAICYNSIVSRKQFTATLEIPVGTVLQHVKARPAFQPPKAAQEAAQRVLKWREEHPDEIQGMTDVGWGRARQLAAGKPVSLDTVRRMAQFNRHRQNAEIAPEYKGTPWKDAGYVAWLGWGGTEGIDWAKRTHTTHTEQEKKAIERQFMVECEYKGCGKAAQHKLSVGDSEFHYCAAHIQGAKQVFEGHGIKEYQEAILEPIEVELVDSKNRFVWDEPQILTKEGQFITHEGRTIFVGGPGQGGGSAGAVSSVDIANNYINELQTRLGTNATVEFVKDLTIEDIDGSIVKADAYYNPLDRKIKINEEFLDKSETPDAIGINCASTASVGYKAVVAHELMHDLDGPDKQYSESEEFLNLFFKEKDRVIEGDTSGVVSKYAFTEPKEFFSEYGSAYVFNPGKLKSMAPNIFSYFDNLIGGEQ